MVTWTVEPNAIQGWVREPNIGFSQVGYIPGQPKVAVIELDKADKVQPKASLYRVNDDGTSQVAFTGDVQTWGMFYKYNYVKFDFSSVQKPGIYYIPHRARTERCTWVTRFTFVTSSQPNEILTMSCFMPHVLPQQSLPTSYRAADTATGSASIAA